MGIEDEKLVVFNGEGIRRVFYEEEWWFVIVDVIEVLTDSVDPSGYLKDMRRRDEELKKGWGQIATPLLVETSGGGQKLNCANTEGIFRIIQSVPSPKAEPFKCWLAKVGYERIQEIEDPELAQKRTRDLYKAKGYSDTWIEKRMRGIQIREELTDEWGQRGLKKGREYAILTSEIHEAVFGVKPGVHKDMKRLERENLRDHMTDLELIFSMLGEASTTEITRSKEVEGFDELADAAKAGGKIAGDAREKLEIESGKKVVSGGNFLEGEG